MDISKPNLIKFKKIDFDEISSNLQELITKIEYQLKNRVLEEQERNFLKSNYEILLKFSLELEKRYDLEIK